MGFHLVVQNRPIGGTTGRHEHDLDRTNRLLAGCQLGHRRIQLPTTENLRERLNCLSLHYFRCVRILSFHFTNEASQLGKDGVALFGRSCVFGGLLVLGHDGAFCAPVH